jgi:hypothetical protein
LASSLPYGRVLAVAADEPTPDPCALQVAVAAAAERAARQRLRLTVLATYSTQKVYRMMVAAGSVLSAGPLMASNEELQADAERRVMTILAAVGPEVPLSWRCVAEPACAELARELAAGPEALVVVGCSGGWSSRRLARRLVLTAVRCGSLAMVCSPDGEAHVLVSAGPTSLGGPIVPSI